MKSSSRKGGEPSPPFVQTKLLTPRPRGEIVRRGGLLKRLEEADASTPFLTLVISPPGYGKTTLVADWLLASGLPRLWYTLDRGDNDPVRFLTYMMRGLRRLSGEAGEALGSVRETLSAASAELLASALIEEIIRFDRLVVVFDDYHAVKNALLHDVLEIVIENQPPGLHLLVLGREDPPLMLARIRTQSRVMEIRAGDLQFSPAETTAFFRSAMRLELDEDTIDTLHSRIEGWVAGLQLAALSLRKQAPLDLPAFVRRFGGSNRYIVDYFAEEVLEKQPEEVRSFLLQTGILDRFCDELCSAVTGAGESRKMLDQLEHAGFFMVPLDEERKWYRYHPLFANYLRTTGACQGSDRRLHEALHARAAGWFESKGLIAEAIKHALLSGSESESLRLIESSAEQVFRNGQYVTLLSWLDGLSEAAVRGSPDLCLFRSWSFFLSGRLEDAAGYIADRAVSACLERSRRGKATVRSLRGWIAEMRGQHVETERRSEMLALLDESDDLFRILTMIFDGRVLYRSGRAVEAAEVFSETLRLARSSGLSFLAHCALHNLAFCLLELGKRRRAELLCREAVEGASRDAAVSPPHLGLVYIPLAESLRLSNELTRAAELAERGLELARQLEAGYLLLESGERVMAMIRLAQGRMNEAALEVSALRESGRRPAPEETDREVELLEAKIAAGRGSREAARAVLDGRRAGGSSCLSLRDVRARLIGAGLLLAENHLKEAETELEGLEQPLQKEGRRGSLIVLRLLQAELCQRLGNRERCLQRLEQAAEMAAPEDIRRPFIDAGRRLVGRYSELRLSCPGFIDAVVTDCNRELIQGSRSFGQRTESSPYGSVSRREREILRLISDGLSNAEIGQCLYISVGTVKWHVNNIFAKLGARSRTQAVARARESGLL